MVALLVDKGPRKGDKKEQGNIVVVVVVVVEVERKVVERKEEAEQKEKMEGTGHLVEGHMKLGKKGVWKEDRWEWEDRY